MNLNLLRRDLDELLHDVHPAVGSGKEHLEFALFNFFEFFKFSGLVGHGPKGNLFVSHSALRKALVVT